MSVIDTLTALFEGAYPEKGTAQNKKDAQATFEANKGHIQDVLGSLVPPAPAAPEAPITMAPDANPSAMNIPPANAQPSSYDVGVSDNTVTQNGQVGDVTPPSAPTPPTIPPIQDQPAVPSPSAPVVSAAPVAPVKAAPAKSTSPEAPAADNSLASALTTPESQDNEQRQQMLAKIEQQKKLGLIPNALGGIADAIGNAAKPFGGQGSSGNQDAVIAAEKEQEASQKGEFETKLKNDPNSDTSKAYRQMVLQIAPDLAKNPDFLKMSAQSIGDKLPLIDTMMKAKASEDAKKVGLAQAKSNRDLTMGLRQDQQQDKLEQNARMGVQNLRGDKSLARAEEQRDAAIIATNRINEVHNAGRELNPIDYTDILGQLYKARSGSAPGEEVLKNIRQPVGSAAFNKAWTYLTGQQAPATSRSVADSLLEMSNSMGKQADKFHDGYMAAHLIKPHGLDEDRWQPIRDTGRGISFADATKQNASPTAGGSDIESKRAALRQKLGI